MIVINRHTLSNGLRIVHHCDDSTKIVAVNVLYNVGSKYDEPGKTGYAHLLEHLMFGGSENVPDFDAVMQIAGGENNAYTTNDITNYYDVLPSRNIETAFWIESDRMQNLCLTQERLSVQKSVVSEEFKERNLNRPYGDASALYRKAAYKKHPYRNNVIGSKISHITEAELIDIERYYRRYYTPDNAVLSVAGNVSFEECLRLAEKWFASIKPSFQSPNDLPLEPLQRRARFVSVERDVPANALYKVYHMCRRNSPNYPSLDLITDILAAGKSSRLNRNLVVRDKLFFSIDASVTGDIDEGLVIVCGLLNPGVKLQTADEAVSSLIADLSTETVSGKELDKVKNKFESSTLFENVGVSELAAQMAYYELLGNAEDLNMQVEAYRKIGAKQITDVSSKYLIPSNCTTLYYRKR